MTLEQLERRLRLLEQSTRGMDYVRAQDAQDAQNDDAAKRAQDEKDAQQIA